jgi:hypothetical protein
MDPRLDEPSMVWYLLRTYLLHPLRPALERLGGEPRGEDDRSLAPREQRRAEADETALAESTLAVS